LSWLDSDEDRDFEVISFSYAKFISPGKVATLLVKGQMLSLELQCLTLSENRECKWKLRGMETSISKSHKLLKHLVNDF